MALYFYNLFYYMSGDIYCFTGKIREACEGITVDITEEGVKAFVSEITSTAMVLMKAAIYLGGRSLTRNMILGIAAMRCVMTSGFDQSWTLIMAAYYGAA